MIYRGRSRVISQVSIETPFGINVLKSKSVASAILWLLFTLTFEAPHYTGGACHVMQRDATSRPKCQSGWGLNRCFCELCEHWKIPFLKLWIHHLFMSQIMLIDLGTLWTGVISREDSDSPQHSGRNSCDSTNFAKSKLRFSHSYTLTQNGVKNKNEM